MGVAFCVLQIVILPIFSIIIILSFFHFLSLVYFELGKIENYNWSVYDLVVISSILVLNRFLFVTEMLDFLNFPIFPDDVHVQLVRLGGGDVGLQICSARGRAEPRLGGRSRQGVSRMEPLFDGGRVRFFAFLKKNYVRNEH